MLSSVLAFLLLNVFATQAEDCFLAGSAAYEELEIQQLEAEVDAVSLLQTQMTVKVIGKPAEDAVSLLQTQVGSSARPAPGDAAAAVVEVGQDEELQQEALAATSEVNRTQQRLSYMADEHFKKETAGQGEALNTHMKEQMENQGAEANAAVEGMNGATTTGLLQTVISYWQEFTPMMLKKKASTKLIAAEAGKGEALQKQSGEATGIEIWIVVDLLILAAFSYLVYQKHNKLKDEDGIVPQCGCYSWLCVVCCLLTGCGTPLACCFPVDKQPCCGGAEMKVEDKA